MSATKKFVSYLKINKSGYVTFKDTNFFRVWKKELEETSEATGHKVGIEIIKNYGSRVEKYDEVVKVYSTRSLTTSTLQAIIDNFEIVSEKPEDDSERTSEFTFVK